MSRSAVIRTIMLAMSMIAIVLAMPIASAQLLLEGRKFDTQAGLVGKAAHVKSDILSFAAGQFHSSDCDQYGYGKGDYRASQQADSVSFEAETRSEQYGRNVWKGVVTGDQIEGTMIFYRKSTWWRPDPAPLDHWFKGKVAP
jgi:hypothetical protein